MTRPVRIAFDVGGVLSKRPEIFVPLIDALTRGGAEVFVISDMHPVEKIVEMLPLNGIELPAGRIISADYATHVELCKTRAAEAIELDILIDDFPAYLAEGQHVRLMMMPDVSRPYYSPAWRTDGSEGDFGRRTPKPSPP